jgi:hypothetical protein
VCVVFLVAGCSGSEGETNPAAQKTVETRTGVTETSEAPESRLALDQFVLAANEIAPGAKLLGERGGKAQAIHGVLGHDGKSYDFYLRGFDVHDLALTDSPGAAMVSTQVERWAEEGDADKRLFDWLIEPPRRSEDFVREQQELGFVTRLAQLGLNTTSVRIERHTLPPGLGEASMAATVHFRSLDAPLDDAVVLFKCSQYVASVDVIGRRGSVGLQDVLELANVMAEKMHRICG